MAGGSNLYGYAEGDAVNNADPFGLFPIFGLPLDALTGPARMQFERRQRLIGIVPDISPAGEVKLLQTVGTIGRHAQRFLNAVKALDAAHLEIAARELRGVDTGWDHVTEVRNSMQTMRKAIRAMDGLLENPKLPEWLAGAAKLLREKASAALETAEQAVPPSN